MNREHGVHHHTCIYIYVSTLTDDYIEKVIDIFRDWKKSLQRTHSRQNMMSFTVINTAAKLSKQNCWWKEKEDIGPPAPPHKNVPRITRPIKVDIFFWLFFVISFISSRQTAKQKMIGPVQFFYNTFFSTYFFQPKQCFYLMTNQSEQCFYLLFQWSEWTDSFTK